MTALKGIKATKLDWDTLNKPFKEYPVEGWYIWEDFALNDNKISGYVLNIDYTYGKTIEVSLTKQAVMDMLADIIIQEKRYLPDGI